MATSCIVRVEIEDDLSTQDQGAIEVVVTLSNGARRWCYFMTPTALQACGDWIDETQVRIHHGTPHMIVLSETLTDDLIRLALQFIDSRGQILACTMAMDDATTVE
jgi:hypothetical protein